MRIDQRYAAGLLVALGLLGPVAAHADVIDEEQGQCLRHEAGDACESGECVPAKCRAGGRPGVPVSEYDCVVCAPRDRRTQLVIGIAAGLIALAGGVWFAKRRRAV